MVYCKKHSLHKKYILDLCEKYLDQVSLLQTFNFNIPLTIIVFISIDHDGGSKKKEVAVGSLTGLRVPYTGQAQACGKSTKENLCRRKIALTVANSLCVLFKWQTPGCTTKINGRTTTRNNIVCRETRLRNITSIVSNLFRDFL